MASATLTEPAYSGAFVSEGFGIAPPVAIYSDELGGLRLAAKDVFALAGQRIGAGNPAWLAGQQPASGSALAIELLLGAGAAWVGKTVTDELAFSLMGINRHYGTPVNPASPLRLPGGSSSGSAVAVAAGHADIALGTDCGGSCRLPASYCGIWGIRPTQGVIAKNGCFALAHSFDTVGWFAADGASLGAVFKVLAQQEIPSKHAAVLHISDDALAGCSPAVNRAFEAALADLAARFDKRHVPSGRLPLPPWAQAHRVLQSAEIWQQHGAWVTAHGDSLGSDVRRRFDNAAAVTRQDVSSQQIVRIQAMTTLTALLPGLHDFLLLPTAPDIAPLCDASDATLDHHRINAQHLLCIAGLAGLPQVSMPWIQIDGAPVGLSLIGCRGNDAGLIAAAQAVHATLAG
ncbi:amidase [Janthinobacterium agaricidamnosum]|uniref:Amidase family protein n=2 Tax=Janthinobacterium agaricidamnosum TaxID=55508 RepID=W0UWP2_9BURK|nr:amidase [Janthinobacterium agaricidamnosum]CDG80829.1 amidase family protein [Janthinobacterium agaricidamnosum NBRC 102515 = DSM 9628]